MVSGRDVVVPVGLQAADRVLLFKLEVIYQSLQQVTRPWHLLEAWEETWLPGLGEGFLLGTSHVRVVPDF